MSKDDELKKIKEEMVSISGELADLRRADKYFPVFGEGNHEPRVVFVGEAPGKTEAKTGRPFVGRAGKFLDELLASINLTREEVYITNIVKDRPPKNRDPLPEEIELYAPLLDRQVSLLEPKILVTLGRFSMTYLMDRNGLKQEIRSIGVLHGKVFDTEINGQKVKIIPLFHPAAAIYNQSLKTTLFEDFKVLKSLV